MVVVTFIFLIVVFVIEIESRLPNLPDDFPQCHRSDPDLDNCWLRGSEIMRKHMRNGIPSLNLPPMEPFLLPEIFIQQGTSSLNMKAKLTNITFIGLTNYKMTYFHFDVPNLFLTINGTIDDLKLVGDYAMDANFIIAPIQGKGNFTVKVDKTYFNIVKQLDIVQRKGKSHLFTTSTNTTIDVSNPIAKLSGLFDGSEELKRVTQKVIDDNIDVLFQELRPVIEKVITGIMDDLIINNLENKIPYDDLYPK